MPDLMQRPVTEWDAFYTAVLTQVGSERLRRIKSRLYEQLELIHEAIEDLEEIKDLFLPVPDRALFARDIECQVEELVQEGQLLSLQIEVLTGLLGENV